MAMNRRAAVASKLLKQAGYTGDLMRLAESLPPETLVQFDKLLNHKEPSVGPGMDSGIVVAYKSGEVVQDRPMQGNFSEEGIAVYEDGGAVEPRSADPEAEILAILDLLDEENRKPERERDPERIDELYSRLTELQSMSAPPVAFEVSDDVYLRPQFEASFGIGESNRRVPFFEDTVKIRDRNMGGIARLGAEIGFPGFSGNDRLSGGVTATYDRTKRLLPDEFIAFGAPSDIRFGPRGVVPRGYDVSYSSGPHTFSGNVTPRQEGVSRDAPGGRSVLDLGYTYSTPEASYSLQATPFGRSVVTDQKTGDTEMDRSIMARYTTRF